jgi:methylaspartate mutase sigma subunit
MPGEGRPTQAIQAAAKPFQRSGVEVLSAHEGLSGSNTETRRLAVVSSTTSDSHTWNLVFLQLLLEEYGLQVINLGACVPVTLLVEQCLACRPDVVVMSSVNGHGFRDGLTAIEAFRQERELAHTPLVIGGKLDITALAPDQTSALKAAGFNAVFDDSGDAVAQLHSFVDGLPTQSLAKEPVADVPVTSARSVIGIFG